MLGKRRIENIQIWNANERIYRPTDRAVHTFVARTQAPLTFRRKPKCGAAREAAQTILLNKNICGWAFRRFLEFNYLKCATFWKFVGIFSFTLYKKSERDIFWFTHERLHRIDDGVKREARSISILR